MTELYQKVEKFVTESFTKINRPSTLAHLKNTVNWVRKLDANPSEALLIAAVVHDIDRAFTGIELNRKSFIDSDYITRHQTSSAEIIRRFLEKEGADPGLTTQVYNLVLNHEVGGSKDGDILKDADRISFFDRDLSKFIEKNIKSDGFVNIYEKFKWNFDNITSPRASKIAKPMYDKAMKLLEGKK